MEPNSSGPLRHKPILISDAADPKSSNSGSARATYTSKALHHMKCNICMNAIAAHYSKKIQLSSPRNLWPNILSSEVFISLLFPLLQIPLERTPNDFSPLKRLPLDLRPTNNSYVLIWNCEGIKICQKNEMCTDESIYFLDTHMYDFLLDTLILDCGLINATLHERGHLGIGSGKHKADHR